MIPNRTLHAPRSSLQCLTLGESANSEREAPPLPPAGRQPRKKKHSLLSCFGEGEFFKKWKGCSSFGVLPSCFGQYGGATAQMAGNEPFRILESWAGMIKYKQCKKILILGIKGRRKFIKLNLQVLSTRGKFGGVLLDLTSETKKTAKMIILNDQF